MASVESDSILPAFLVLNGERRNLDFPGKLVRRESKLETGFGRAHLLLRPTDDVEGRERGVRRRHVASVRRMAKNERQSHVLAHLHLALVDARGDRPGHGSFRNRGSLTAPAGREKKDRARGASSSPQPPRAHLEEPQKRTVVGNGRVDVDDIDAHPARARRAEVALSREASR